MEKAVLQPSQNLGRSGGSRTYHRKRASSNSCATIYVPLTVDGCTIGHSPIFAACRKRRMAWTGSPSRVSASAFSEQMVFLLTPPLSHVGGMICRPEILPAPERCNGMYCDNKV